MTYYDPFAGLRSTGSPRSWHSLHDMAPSGHANLRIRKPDRLLVGVLAGAVLVYLLGRSLGLGKTKTDD